MTREHLEEWFDLDCDSPYMLIVASVLEKHRRKMTDDDEKLGIAKLNVPRSSLPAVTQVDYSARIQTIHQDTNPLCHGLFTRSANRRVVAHPLW